MYVCDNYYFNNYRPTVRRSDTFQYFHHKSSNKSTKKTLRVLDLIEEFHILQKLISINKQLLIFINIVLIPPCLPDTYKEGLPIIELSLVDRRKDGNQ